MIFAVAGTQLPFPRLMQALDAIAWRRGLDVLAQTADPHFAPMALKARPFMPPAEFDRHIRDCRVIVAHAGMGIIIAAAEYRKPLVLMGRRADLGEHRNDHQLATVRRFQDIPGIHAVSDEAELGQALDEILSRRDGDAPGLDLSVSQSRQGLISSLRQAIDRP